MNETKVHSGNVTAISEQIERQHRINQQWPLPTSIKEKIEAKLAEDQAVATLARVRAEIRAKRSHRLPPGSGLFFGTLIGTALWGLIAVAVWALWR